MRPTCTGVSAASGGSFARGGVSIGLGGEDSSSEAANMVSLLSSAVNFAVLKQYMW